MRSTREGHLRPRTAPQPAWRSLWFACAFFPPLVRVLCGVSLIHYYPLPYRLLCVFSLCDPPHLAHLATVPISPVHPLLAMNHVSSYAPYVPVFLRPPLHNLLT